jgi:hypothetical protein
MEFELLVISVDHRGASLHGDHWPDRVLMDINLLAVAEQELVHQDHGTSDVVLDLCNGYARYHILPLSGERPNLLPLQLFQSSLTHTYSG